MKSDPELATLVRSDCDRCPVGVAAIVADEENPLADWKRESFADPADPVVVARRIRYRPIASIPAE